MRVAAEGEAAEPRVPAPPALRPVLGFGRLSAASYALIERVVEDDGIFRSRVADAAVEAEVGRAGWLWLHRPVDWADDPVFTGGVLEGQVPEAAAGRRGRLERDGAARLRKAAADAEAARKQAVATGAEARKDLARVVAERDALAARVEELDEARRAAVAKLKATEADLAEARREVKALRKAAKAAPAASPSAPPTPPPAAAAAPAPDPVDRLALESAVVAAVDAAARLSEALGRASSTLDLPAPATPTPSGTSRTPTAPKAAGAKAAGAKAAKAPKRGRGKRPRVLPSLPPGVFDDTPEADRHLIGARANLVVVDGYNLARAAWSGLGTEEERRRTVALLEDVQARSGGKVVVVFDGASGTVAPRASKAVRVAFSATGQTADDAIGALLEQTSHAQPVVVVSSDKAVAADARAQGAAVLSSQAFLRAAGR